MLIEIALKKKLRLQMIRVSKPRGPQVFSLKVCDRVPIGIYLTIHSINIYFLSTRAKPGGRNLISYVNRENLI